MAHQYNPSFDFNNQPDVLYKNIPNNSTAQCVPSSNETNLVHEDRRQPLYRYNPYYHHENPTKDFNNFNSTKNIAPELPPTEVSVHHSAVFYHNVPNNSTEQFVQSPKETLSENSTENLATNWVHEDRRQPLYGYNPYYHDENQTKDFNVLNSTKNIAPEFPLTELSVPQSEPAVLYQNVPNNSTAQCVPSPNETLSENARENHATNLVHEDRRQPLYGYNPYYHDENPTKDFKVLNSTKNIAQEFPPTELSVPQSELAVLYQNVPNNSTAQCVPSSNETLSENSTENFATNLVHEDRRQPLYVYNTYYHDQNPNKDFKVLNSTKNIAQEFPPTELSVPQSELAVLYQNVPNNSTAQCVPSSNETLSENSTENFATNLVHEDRRQPLYGYNTYYHDQNPTKDFNVLNSTKNIAPEVPPTELSIPPSAQLLDNFLNHENTLAFIAQVESLPKQEGPVYINPFVLTGAPQPTPEEPLSYVERKTLGKTQEAAIKCKFCERLFTKKSYLGQHINAKHNNQKQFTCKTCGKKFITPEILVIHVEKHKQNKPYKCKYCPKQYNFKSDLNIHMFVHDKSRAKWLCPTCAKGFLRKDQFIKHILSHKRRSALYDMRKDIF